VSFYFSLVNLLANIYIIIGQTLITPYWVQILHASKVWPAYI